MDEPFDLVFSRRNTAIDRSRKMRLSGWLSSLMIAVPYFLGGCGHFSTTRVLARVLETTGEAFLVAQSSQSLQTRTPLRTGMLISQGETIETSEKASITISLLPGMIFQMNSNATVKIDELILAKGGHDSSFLMESRRGHIQLIRGSLSAVTTETFVPTDLRITIPAGKVIASQKTAFYVGVTTETVRLINSDGQLRFQGKAGSASETLDAGYFRDWGIASGAAISEARPVKADEVASQQVKDTRALESKAVDLMRK